MLPKRTNASIVVDSKGSKEKIFFGKIFTMLPAPRVDVQLLDAVTKRKLPAQHIDGIKTFQGASGQEFYVSVLLERTHTDDKRVFTVLAKIDGDQIGYSFNFEGFPKQKCIFDGFPINNGCGRSMFKFNDMMVGSSANNNDDIGTISIDVHVRGEILTDASFYTEANRAPREGTEKPHAKFFENQRLSTVGGTVVENKYRGLLRPSYTCGELLSTTTIRYDDSTHVSLRASEQKKRKLQA